MIHVPLVPTKGYINKGLVGQVDQRHCTYVMDIDPDPEMKEGIEILAAQLTTD